MRMPRPSAPGAERIESSLLSARISRFIRYAFAAAR